MSKYLVKLEYETEIEAEDSTEARDIFLEEVEEEPQQTFMSFVSDNLIVKKI
jgi:hypothetical protein